MTHSCGQTNLVKSKRAGQNSVYICCCTFLILIPLNLGNLASKAVKKLVYTKHFKSNTLKQNIKSTLIINILNKYCTP